MMPEEQQIILDLSTHKRQIKERLMPDINMGAIAEALNDKVDRDCQNIDKTTGEPYLAGLGMPSGTYDDLTLGASASTYTAPANGWFTLTKNASAGQFVCFESLANGCRSFAQTSIAEYPSATIPVRKGDSVICYYNASGAVLYFRFVYAQGEAN